MTKIELGPVYKELTDKELEIIHSKVSNLLIDLTKQYEINPVYINALVMGMARRSLQDLVGKKLAMEFDKAGRETIGWDKL